MMQLINVDAGYRDWISSVCKRFRTSQIRAAVKVNDEMLRFYWNLGRDIVRMKEGAGYGDFFYDNVSRDLQDALPGIKSFSKRNLTYMAKFYQLYLNTPILQQVVAKSPQGGEGLGK